MSTARTPVGGDAPEERSEDPADEGFDGAPAAEGPDDGDVGDADQLDGTAADDLSGEDPVDDASDLDGASDTLVVELDDEPAADTDVDGRPLGDELDAELEVEAAEMAPLVELPDRPHFAADPPPSSSAATPGPTPYRGDAVSVRVRGHGRVPARRVRRVIRRVDPLSVLKLAFFFNVCVFAMFLVAAVLLWSAAIGSGSTDNIESFLIDIGFEDFQLVGTDLFRGFFVFGGGLVIAFTVLAVLLALLFNLISDVVGGIRLTVIEPLVVEAAADARSQGAQAE